ncbi:polysaccharide pyruvyl transferase family protein [Lacinutrix undariae]
MDSKKIGLLTLPLNDNYGGIIQLTALNSYLEGEGYEVYHLNKRYEVSRLKQLVRQFFKWNPLYFIFDLNSHGKKDRYIQKLNSFIKVELKKSTKNIFTNSQLSNTVESLGLDTIIVGSDQVWRESFINENYKDYFLGFVNSKSIKKISYAASFGIDTWGAKGKVSSIKTLLNDFTAVSVREDSGVLVCKNTFELTNNVAHVLDPTFLPERTYYESIIAREFVSDKKIGLFNYVLDKSPKKNAIIEKTAKELDLSVDSIYLENNLKAFLKNKTLKPSIGEWLYHFKNAEFIITDSFHGTVFSIIFNKKFIAIGNKSRGVTRFTSLLKSLGLLDRFILDDNENYLTIAKKHMDYEFVNMKLADLKLNSKNFLKKALK